MLRKLKIGKRLTLSFSVLVLVSVIVGVVAMLRFAETEKNLDNIADRRLPAMMLVGQMNREFMLIRLTTISMLLAQTDNERQALENSLATAIENYQQLSDAASVFHKTTAGKAAFDAVTTARQAYDDIHRQLLTLIRDNKPDEAQRFREHGFDAVDLGQKPVQRAVNPGLQIF